jgi:hypothetical protein
MAVNSRFTTPLYKRCERISSSESRRALADSHEAHQDLARRRAGLARLQGFLYPLAAVRQRFEFHLLRQSLVDNSA